MRAEPTRHYCCYIDEAGDEGLGPGSSEWFVLAGVVVDAAEDAAASRVIDRIRSRYHVGVHGPVHFRNLKHELKVAVASEVSQEHLTICVAAFPKRLPSNSHLGTPPALYLHAAERLLQRVDWLMRERGGTCRPVFADRSNTSCRELEAYVDSAILRGGRRAGQTIEHACIRETFQVKMLQVADVAASAVFRALNPHPFGFTEPRYFEALGPRLYRRKGRLLGYGVSVAASTQDLRILLKLHPWLKALEKKRPPAPGRRIPQTSRFAAR